MADEVKKEYNAIRKTYSKLPEYNKINSEFEISTLEASEFILRDIRTQMTDKLSDFAKIIEGIITADSFTSLHEIKSFLPKDKKDAFDIFGRIMLINRKAVSLRVDENDKENSHFIVETFREWQEIKEILSPLLNKIEDAWKEDNTKKQKLEYFG
jgi:hypothetical protein